MGNDSLIVICTIKNGNYQFHVFWTAHNFIINMWGNRICEHIKDWHVLHEPWHEMMRKHWSSNSNPPI